MREEVQKVRARNRSIDCSFRPRNSTHESSNEDTRSAAEKARDTAGIVGRLKYEGYVSTPEAEAVHQRLARGEITPEEAIKIFGDRGLGPKDCAPRNAELRRHIHQRGDCLGVRLNEFECQPIRSRSTHRWQDFRCPILGVFTQTC
jgi:hypothetical protein